MKSIGILGGTFNPIHNGHLAIAQAVRDQLKLERVLFIPCFKPPHKSTQAVIAAKHRLAMIKAAIRDNKNFELCDLEIKRKGRSYSIDTIEELKQQYPKKTKFHLIVGADMLKGLKNWRRIKDLSRLVKFVAVDRKGYAGGKAHFPLRKLSVLDLGISSSYLRSNIKRGQSVRYFLPEKVNSYIKKHRLYR